MALYHLAGIEHFAGWFCVSQVRKSSKDFYSLFGEQIIFYSITKQ